MKLSETTLWGVAALSILGGGALFVLPDPNGVTWSQKQWAEHEMAADLLDPDTGKYDYTGAGGPFVCGKINAKNGFGAYTGFTQFIADKRKTPSIYVIGRAGNPPWNLEQEVGLSGDRNLKAQLAQCEGGSFFSTDEKNAGHDVDSQGRDEKLG